MNKKDNGFWLLILIAGLIIIVSILLTVSNALGVDFPITLNFVGRLLIVCCIVGLLTYMAVTSLSISALLFLPIFLSGLAWSFIPVLDAWANPSADSLRLSGLSIDVPWYGMALWQTLLTLTPSIIGYGYYCYTKYRNDYY